MKWRYGDSWEKFPIEDLAFINNKSVVKVHDIFNSFPAFLKQADLLIIDPPWNQGNLTSFYTKAYIDAYRFFDKFLDRLFYYISLISPQKCYLEMGKQFVYNVSRRLHNQFPFCTIFPVYYYRTRPSFFLCGSMKNNSHYLDLSEKDEMDCIEMICKEETYSCVGDLCMGRGAVGLAAYEAGKPFVGTELNKRRLAVLLDKLSSKGAQITLKEDKKGGKNIRNEISLS